MKRVQGKIIFAIKKKMGMNFALGGNVEEMLSSIKLIISFGQEKLKLNQF